MTAPARGKSPEAEKKLARAAVARIFDALGAANPAPRTELHYSSPYTLLVAVVLSAQATDAGVNRATKGLFAAADTPEAMVALGLEGIRHHIRTIGLFNAKAANVLKLSEQLLARHGGQVPRDRASLEALAGVGRKTANVVLNEAFGEPTLAVDTHVFRVARRIGLSAGKTPEAVERDLLAQVPRRWAGPAHHLLILHGRYLCKARKPECWRCPIARDCRFPDKSPEKPAGKPPFSRARHSAASKPGKPGKPGRPGTPGTPGKR
jgi:endonuclease-3